MRDATDAPAVDLMSVPLTEAVVLALSMGAIALREERMDFAASISPLRSEFRIPQSMPKRDFRSNRHCTNVIRMA